jgi:RNA polymerase primary sigma factor
MKRKRQKSQEVSLTDDDVSVSPEEEGRLAAAVASGDAEARERMIIKNLVLARKIALQWLGHGIDAEDLIAEATYGLIRAVDQFPRSRGVPFGRYASYMIKQAIGRAIENAGLIALPTYARQLVNSWKRRAHKLAGTLGRTPTSEEIAESLGFSRKQAHVVAMATTIGVKLASTVIGEGCRRGRLENFVADTVTVDEPNAGVDRKELRQRLKRLNRLELMVLTLRYGLNGNPPHSVEDVKFLLGKTRHAVREIQVRAENKLRKGPKSRSRSVSCPVPVQDQSSPTSRSHRPRGKWTHRKRSSSPAKHRALADPVLKREQKCNVPGDAENHLRQIAGELAQIAP